MKQSLCAECGVDMQVDDDGIANHLSADGAIDYDLDAEHVAIDEDGVIVL